MKKKFITYRLTSPILFATFCFSGSNMKSFLLHCITVYLQTKLTNFISVVYWFP